MDPSDAALAIRLSYAVHAPADPCSASEDLQGAGARLPFSDVQGVWWRPKPTLKQLQRSSFRDREWQFALEALEALTHQARWVNPRAVDQRCRHKPGQLIAAERAGLDVPPTLISNDAQAVAAFLAPLGPSAIYKALSWYGDEPAQALFTTRVAVASLADLQGNIAAAPGIYQPYIDKDYELRITVVDEEIFAVRIDSQSHSDTKTDWRRNPGAVAHLPTELPPEIARRLLAFHKAQDLVFGAYDFIVTPEGRHVFLEVNSLGQWLWTEEMTGLPISDAVAAALLRPPADP